MFAIVFCRDRRPRRSALLSTKQNLALCNTFLWTVDDAGPYSVRAIRESPLRVGASDNYKSNRGTAKSQCLLFFIRLCQNTLAERRMGCEQKVSADERELYIHTASEETAIA